MPARDPNPWLLVPANDYEGHMKLPEVGQSPVLASILREDLERLRPMSLAVFGCACGNGFEEIDSHVTVRVAGIDINPAYLAIARDRHASRLNRLDLIEADLLALEPPAEAFDLVHAALVFEYVDPAAAVDVLRHWVKPGGTLTVVLQLPSGSSTPVTSTRYESVRVLAPILKLVDPDVLAGLLTGRDFEESLSRVVPLPGGKAFHVSRWSRKPEADRG